MLGASGSWLGMIMVKYVHVVCMVEISKNKSIKAKTTGKMKELEVLVVRSTEMEGRSSTRNFAPKNQKHHSQRGCWFLGRFLLRVIYLSCVLILWCKFLQLIIWHCIWMIRLTAMRISNV